MTFPCALHPRCEGDTNTEKCNGEPQDEISEGSVGGIFLFMFARNPSSVSIVHSSLNRVAYSC